MVRRPRADVDAARRTPPRHPLADVGDMLAWAERAGVVVVSVGEILSMAFVPEVHKMIAIELRTPILKTRQVKIGCGASRSR